jgi:sugar/nucleoside kinase (ribokinase family)
MNDRTTLDTQLNVFAGFQPKVPAAYQDHTHLFLGNIDPGLQRNVQGQMRKAVVVGGDTMNFWITGQPDELKKTIAGWHMLLINDSEARQLSGEHNLLKAAAKIHALGPQTLVIKRGEHGATLYRGGRVFTVPGFPLELVRDPTGAGDCFAGGFMGYLASCGEASEAALRRAMVYGSVLGSFCVEQFGTERLQSLTRAEIDERYRQFQDLTRFD